MMNMQVEPITQSHQGANCQAEASTREVFLVQAGTSPRWRAGAGTQQAASEQGVLLVEGAIFRINGQRHARPAQVLLERLRERGTGAFCEVTGDFVACYVTREGVHGFKSLTGQHQLYYGEGQGLFCNRLFPFHAATPVPEWDEEYFGRHTLIVPGSQFHAECTPLAGVRRVLPGQLVTLGPGVTKRALVMRQYQYKLDPQQRREDVAPEILRLLRESVQDHLHAAPGADVCIEISGGLDSSFVACLVGEVTQGAKGVMFSQPNVPSHHISEGYAREVAERYGIDLRIIPPDELPAVPQLEPAYSDEPSDFFWFGELFSEAVAQMTRPGGLVFTGFGADQLFLRSPAMLPHLLGRGEWGAFFSALRPAARLMSRSPVSLALQSLVSQIPRELYYRMARHTEKWPWNPLDVCDVNMDRLLHAPVGWLRADDRRAAWEDQRRQTERELVGDGIICDNWGYFAATRAVTAPHFARRGLKDASPFCDLRLIDYVYDHVSALLVHDFNGRYKELLREAQKGVVPESLRARKNDTFVFNSFQLRYFNQAREYFHSLVDHCPAGWVHAPSVRAEIEALQFGLMNASTRSVVALMGYLSWQRAFLRQAGGESAALERLPWSQLGNGHG